jgi:putative ABC transport system permease protein
VSELASEPKTRGGWRPALRIARRSVRRHLGRSILIAALIAVPIAGATLMDGLLRTLTGPEHSAYERMGEADGQALVTDHTTLPNWQPGGDPSDGTGERKATSVDVERLLPPGSRAVPDLVFGLIRLTEGDRIVRADIDLVPVGDPLTDHIARLDSGRLPKGPDEVLVTEPLAERLGLLDGGEVRAGATITADDGPRVAVTGLAVVPTSTDWPVIVAPPDSALKRAPGLADMDESARQYLVDLPPGADGDALWPKLTAQGVAFTPRAVLTDPARYPLVYSGESALETIGPIALIVGFGVLEVVLLAGAAFAVGARRQVRELGLIAANGGTAKHVGRTVLAQGLTLGLFGAVGGLLFGGLLLYAGKPLWEGFSAEVVDTWRFGWIELAVAGLVGLLSGLGAALLPAIGVARMRPVDALAQRFRATALGARLPVVGVVVLAVGIAGVVVSGVLARQRIVEFRDRPNATDGYAQPDLSLPTLGVLVAGLVAVIGLVMVTSGLVATLARAAGRLPLSSRLAMRDAGRHRHRTVPAVAAIMIVVAGSVTLAFVFAASAVGDVKTTPDDTITVHADPSLNRQDPGQEADARRDILDGTRAMAAALPGGTAVAVPAAAQQDNAMVALAVDQQGRCSTGQIGIADPAALELALGHKPSAAVLADLESGTVVALDECMLTSGAVRTETFGSGEKPVELAARYEPRPAGTAYFELPAAFISPKAARERGWTARLDVIAVRFSPSATQDDIDKAIATGEDRGLQVSDPYDVEDEVNLANLALAGGAGLVTLLGVAVTVALSAAEGRADLATLAAIGAQPRRRRTLAGAQALVLSGVGTLLGLVLGGVLGFAAAPLSGALGFAVPWQNLAITVLGVPVLAVCVAMAVTRSRLPMVRRVE